MKRLTNFELRAAFIACSNFTPPRGTSWKQAAQGRAARKFYEEMLRREFKRIEK